MQTSVKLQGDFSYPIILFLIALFLIGAIIIYLILTKEEKETIEEVKEIPQKNLKNIPVIKKKYLKQIVEIEYRYHNNKIKIREAYQLISQSIRMFIFEVTDITTQNYSLSEIKKLDMPVLYELIEEYYEPEFAFKSEGDFEASLNKARSVIEKWS